MSDKLNVEPMKLHAERVLAQHADWDAGLRQSEMDVLKLAIMSKDLAADVTALLAALGERDAEVARLRGLLTYKEHSGAVRCSYCDGFVQDGQVQHKADCAVGKA